MRPENILAWAEGVEFGHPPPSQPAFDHFGTSLPNTQKTAPSNQADAEAYLNHIRKRRAEIEALERVTRQQKILFPNIEAKGHPPPSQPPFDQFGNLLPNISKSGSPTWDREAYLNHISKRNAEIAELARVTRQQKILFPNSGVEDLKPEPRPYQIPRKPVAKSNETYPPPPQAVLLRNGETKRLDKISTYLERVRELGYPEALCPLAIAKIPANNTRGADCTGAEVVKQKDDCQNCHQNQNLNTPSYRDGSHTPQDSFLAPETSPSSGEALALRPAQAAISDPVTKAIPILQQIDKPPTAHNTPTDHQFIENEMRRLSV